MKLFISLVLVLFTINLKAQSQLSFSKTDSSKTINIKLKDLVRLSFNGYIMQEQEIEGRVTSLNDSTITLTPRKKILQNAQSAKTIFLKDITGFRKYSNFRPASEIIYSIVGIGIAGSAAAIVSKANLSPIISFASAAGTQILSTGLKNSVISSRVKNRLNNRWVMNLKSSN
jgi:hypothetical protein